MYRIISLSRDLNVLLRRNNVLAMAGFSVLSPAYPEEAAIIAAKQRADAIVIGDSFERLVRQRLIAEMRRFCPNCPIFFVYALPARTGEVFADESVDVTNGQDLLVVALREKLRQEVHLRNLHPSDIG
jgi:hypothetical protein